MAKLHVHRTKAFIENTLWNRRPVLTQFVYFTFEFNRICVFLPAMYDPCMNVLGIYFGMLKYRDDLQN